MMKDIFKMIFILAFFLMKLISAYINPIQSERDSPDPGVVYNGHFYYAATTMGWNGHFFPIWKSQDLFQWEQDGWGLLQPPQWTKCCDFWAPEIHIVNQLYMLYYTARDKSGQLCIGLAQSESPSGPYTDIGRSFLRNNSEGVIDATIFQQNGHIFMIYKVDGNAHGNPTYIQAIQLSQDGKRIINSSIPLIRDTLEWEHGIVEAPWVVKYNNYYYLFYSSCAYNNKCYSVGVARSSQLFGPFEKHGTPILYTRPNESNKSWEGPGHCSVLRTLKGNYAMVYHAWPHGQINTKRVMMVDEVKWVDGWPVVNNGSPSEDNTPQF